VWLTNLLIILTISIFLDIGSSVAAPMSILIDPGHSPASPGATACSGEREYIFNNKLAIVVVATLKRHGLDVDLSKQYDEDLPLERRVILSSGKDLLLSIHHDSVQPQFLLRQPGKHGNCSQKAQGFSIFVSRKNPYYKRSLHYASELGTALLKRGLLPSLHHSELIAGESRQLLSPDKGIYLHDELSVLKNAKSPAILLEAAVIVNPEDEVLSVSDKYRMSIAEATYDMLNTKR